MWHSIPAIIHGMWPASEGVKPPHSLSGLHWLFLWEKRPFSIVTHSETGSGIGLEAAWDVGRGGVKSQGKAGWVEVIRLVIYVFSSLLKMEMLFIQAPVMYSYTP